MIYVKKIKVISNQPILRNLKTGTWYKKGEEILNPNDILLQIAKVHADVFSIVEEVEEKVKKVEKIIKKDIKKTEEVKAIIQEKIDKSKSKTKKSYTKTKNMKKGDK